MPCISDYGRADQDCYDKLNEATRAACELARVLRGQAIGRWDSVSEKTKKWVEHHDKMDAARIKREKEEHRRKKLKKQALKKLSHKEREALGL